LRVPTDTLERRIERLLIRLPNWLGDTLMARPLLHAARARWPEAEIRAVGPEAPLPLLAADLPGVRFEAWPAAGGARGALTRSLRAWHADAALVLPPSFSSAWFAWGSGANRRIGFAGEARGVLLTDAIPRPIRGDCHVSEEYLSLGARLGLEAVEVPSLVPTTASRTEAARLRREAGSSDGPYAVLGPGAAFGPAKRWPLERFAEVGERLRARGLGLVIAGAGVDSAECSGLRARLASPVADLAGRTDLVTLAALCAGASVVVCNDSGLAHLAAASGAPTVAVFGSTSSAWSAPRGARVRVVQRPPVCSPCFRRTCAIGYRCLVAVDAGRVVRACAEVA
jgi:heptosyltransferase-2